MRFVYAPAFLRQLKRLPIDIKDEAKEALRLFPNRDNHPRLKVHKLKGPLSGQHAFSVNYRFRIIFHYQAPDIIHILAIGDHDIYHL